MKVEDVKKVAVFGAGTMGPGLAQVFATAGYDVALYSRKAETLEKAMSVAKTNMGTFVEHGLLAADAVAPARALCVIPSALYSRKSCPSSRLYRLLN